MNYPAKTIKDAFNACDPAEQLTADDSRYVDFAEARGSDGAAASTCRKRILRSQRPLVQLLAGHRGCGKSTELSQLKNSLEKDGFTVVWIDAEVDLDLEDTEPTDILLALIRGLETELRKQEMLLPQNELNEFLNWFSEVVLEKNERVELEAAVKAEIKGGIQSLFGGILSTFTGMIKTGTDSKKTIRHKLEPKLSQLLDRGKLLFQNGRALAMKKGNRDLVLIVDGLDRIALKTKSDGRNSHEILFIDRGDLLKGFDCHTILTVPISLMFSSRASNLDAVFPDRCVLPMVKIADRNREPDLAGCRLMRQVLEKRLDVNTLTESGTVERLIELSGGDPRQLMNLIRSAMDMIDEAPITLGAVEKAFHRIQNDYGRSIPNDHWSLLAEVDQSHAVKNDAAHQSMLYNLSVLEYQNGDRWCAINPAVRELPQFLDAVKALRANSPGASPPVKKKAAPKKTSAKKASQKKVTSKKEPQSKMGPKSL